MTKTDRNSVSDAPIMRADDKRDADADGREPEEKTAAIKLISKLLPSTKNLSSFLFNYKDLFRTKVTY